MIAPRAASPYKMFLGKKAGGGPRTEVPIAVEYAKIATAIERDRNSTLAIKRIILEMRAIKYIVGVRLGLNSLKLKSSHSPQFPLLNLPFLGSSYSRMINMQYHLLGFYVDQISTGEFVIENPRLWSRFFTGSRRATPS